MFSLFLIIVFLSKFQGAMPPPPAPPQIWACPKSGGKLVDCTKAAADEVVVEVFAPETDKLAVTTEFAKVAFPAVDEVAGAETEVTGAGLSMRSATCWIVTVDWLLRDNRGQDIKTMDKNCSCEEMKTVQAKGQLNCDDKPRSHPGEPRLCTVIHVTDWLL